MKLKLFVILVILTLSQVILGRIQHSSVRRAHNKASKNLFYQFLLGFLASLGGDSKFVDECSQHVPGWESAGKTEETNDSMNTDLKHQHTIFDKALSMIKDGVTMICEFKEDIVKFLEKQTRRYIRLFLQGKTRSRRMTWNISSLISDVAGDIKKAAVAVKDGVAKVGDTVVAGVKWVGKKVEEVANFIQTQMKEWLKPVFDLYEALKARVMKFLKEHPFLMNLALFAACFIKNKGVELIKELHHILKRFVELLPKLATVGGWIRLVANLICHWEGLKKGMESLKKGLEATNKEKRYHHFGHFAGHFLRAISH